MILPILLLTAAAPQPSPPTAVLWGEHGHEMVGRAAAQTLPAAMPDFFRAAADQLSYLNPEPDRWRDRSERELDPAMDAHHSPEHYVDLELVPPGARAAADRLAYADSLRAHGQNAAKAGIAHFRALELTQRLRSEFRLWRAETDPRRRAWIEQRILNDAGILGHYVADLSNPHHTSIHHNGWVGDNPRGYATDNRFHGRFESEFVTAQLQLADVRGAMTGAPSAFPELRPAIWSYVDQTHGHLTTLYELDRRERFGRDTRGAEHRAFAAERLAAGATMLRDLWWTAWVTSAPAAGAPVTR